MCSYNVMWCLQFFEHGTFEQRKELASQLSRQMLPLSLQMYGCRVIQKVCANLSLYTKGFAFFTFQHSYSSFVLVFFTTSTFCRLSIHELENSTCSFIIVLSSIIY